MDETSVEYYNLVKLLCVDLYYFLNQLLYVQNFAPNVVPPHNILKIKNVNL